MTRVTRVLCNAGHPAGLEKHWRGDCDSLLYSNFFLLKYVLLTLVMATFESKNVEDRRGRPGNI